MAQPDSACVFGGESWRKLLGANRLRVGKLTDGNQLLKMSVANYYHRFPVLGNIKAENFLA